MIAAVQVPVLLVAGIVIIIACGLGGAAALLEWDFGVSALSMKRGSRQVTSWQNYVAGQRDVAAQLGWPFKRWMYGRIGITILGLLGGILCGVPLLIFYFPLAGYFGFGFAMEGRGANRRLKMERAFLGQLRNLRDRMSVSNQSLDTGLQELGRNAGPELKYVFEPLARGGSVVENLVEMGTRSRSPIVEGAAGVLIWARTRSLDTLIQAIDDILLPVGEAQMSLQEEAMVTLSQQRAVTFAMIALMSVMFINVIKVDNFRAFYQSFGGQIVLAVVIAMFMFLVWVLKIIVKTPTWTRWDLSRLKEQQDRLGV